MKKIVLIAAAAGLMSLAACNKPADTSANNAADAAVIDNTAGVMEDTSNATTNEVVGNAMDAAPEATGNATTNAM
ncbi:MAG: hypothetical protein JWL96_3044 [Sphingomonas bacterium]|jgi:uncharacterized protein involved in copper resistance|uniref:hypothetical protein n=1 Tax=Sphingomonas bacterium TaxID=1895847 RepID=UPI00261DE0AF|nr:hypothetical protein [Sphingomonas bacterium]MDB5710974.1 hypothetical protein [Sphingomonas bacterium]